MKNRIVYHALLGTALLTLSGCSAFRQSVGDQDPTGATTLTARFDQRDLIEMAIQIRDDILNHPFPREEGANPIIAPLGIHNNTRTHLDANALENTIVTELLNTGRMQFVNTNRRDDLMREQGFQLANATEETRTQIGRQLGARYMLTGSMTEIAQASGKQVRASKQQDIYYQLTVEITDLETGLIVLRKQRDRLRRQSRPLFGW
jgi:penicillin-binding protein activator